MELIPSGSLLQKLQLQGKLTEDKAARIVIRLLKLLIYLEEKEIIHRDIKLNNILFLESQDETDIKIIDFGLAIRKKDIFKKAAAGTPGFIAPEILRGLPYDCKADNFSVGIVLYAM